MKMVKGWGKDKLDRQQALPLAEADMLIINVKHSKSNHASPWWVFLAYKEQGFFTGVLRNQAYGFLHSVFQNNPPLL